MAKLTGIALVSALLATLAACNLQSPKIVKADGRPVTRLFEGFAYVGQVRGNVFRQSYDLPAKLAPRDGYAFKRQVSSAQETPSSLLVGRLEQLGFNVTKSPKDDGTGNMYTEPGGAVFEIQARTARCLISIWKSAERYLPELRAYPWERRYWEAGGYTLMLSDGCERVLY